MRLLNYGFPDLTNINTVGMGEDDPLNSLLPSGLGNLETEKGRGDIVIQPRRGIKRRASSQEPQEKTMKKSRSKEAVEE